MGDGYTAGELATTYTSNIETVLSHMFNEGEDPFPRYQNFFNVFRIDVISNESGADDPCGNIYRDTALGASYDWSGIDRFLYVNDANANAALNTGLAGSGIRADMKLITVNSTKYGGGGGNFTVFAGGNNLAGELMLHELGHQFSGLADEYGGDGTLPGTYEPGEVNLTRDPNNPKWAGWVGYVDGNLGVVGAYEGGQGYDHGIYRPTQTSKMRALNQKFNIVCVEKIVRDIYSLVKPFDSYLSNSSLLTDPNQLWVDTVDPNVYDISWYVNNALVTADGGETFRLEDYGFGAGDYIVNATAVDDTDWVLGDKPSQSVTWDVHLTPEPATLTLYIMVYGATLLRRRGITARRRWHRT